MGTCKGNEKEYGCIEGATNTIYSGWLWSRDGLRDEALLDVQQSCLLLDSSLNIRDYISVTIQLVTT